MTAPKDAEYQWTGYPWTNGILLPNCKTCGAVVMDEETHTEWHRELLKWIVAASRTGSYRAPTETKS